MSFGYYLRFGLWIKTCTTKSWIAKANIRTAEKLG
jgi:hypothetical protein